MKKYHSRFLAEDITPLWKDIILEAKSRVIIFTPFFDRALLSLIRNAQIPKDKVSVVTFLNVPNILELPNQLLAARQVILEGHDLRNLIDLHAKIMLVDGKTSTIGSQNFTNYGKRSKESTAYTEEVSQEDSFAQTLEKWYDKSEPIELELLDLLIERLRSNMQKYRILIEETKPLFDEAVTKYKNAKLLKEIDHFRKLEKSSPIKLSSTYIHSEFKEMLYGPDDPYMSLKPSSGYSFTDWSFEGTEQQRRLHRLNMYPIIIKKSFRMGYARVGSSVITYIRFKSHWSQRIEGERYRFYFTFPKSNTRHRNVELSIYHFDYSLSFHYDIELLFDGLEILIVSKTFKGQESSQKAFYFKERIDRIILSDEEKVDEIFRKGLKAFHLLDLKRSHKNAIDFFPTFFPRIGLFSYHEIPIYTVEIWDRKLKLWH